MPPEQMMQSAEVERLERRLMEEISGLRAEMYRELHALRLELHDGLAALRQELKDEMAAMRADILKWSFMFWIGQVATIAALLSYMLRTAAR